MEALDVPSAVHYVVQANGIEDESEVYFSCSTLQSATDRAVAQLEDDCLDNDEYNDAPPDIEDTVDENTGAILERIVSIDDYMSYKITPVPHYA